MVHGGALAGWAVLPALRLWQYPVRHRASDHDASVPRLPEAAHVLAQDRDGDAGLAARLSGNWRVTFRFEDGSAVDVDYVDYH